MLLHRACVDLEAMEIKEYFGFPKASHYWSLTTRLFSVMSRTLVGGWVLLLCREAVGVLCSPSRVGLKTMETIRTFVFAEVGGGRVGGGRIGSFRVGGGRVKPLEEWNIRWERSEGRCIVGYFLFLSFFHFMNIIKYHTLIFSSCDIYER